MERYSLGNICLFFLVVIFFCHIMRADDTITIHNKTDVNFYGSIYKKPKNTRELAISYAEPQLFEAGKTYSVPRKDLPFFERLGTDRVFFFSVDKDMLAQELRHEASLKIPSTNVGDIIRGKEFFIGFNEFGELAGYTTFEWNVWREIKKRVFGVIDPVFRTLIGTLNPVVEKVRQLYVKKENNPYYATRAVVRPLRNASIMSSDEKKYVTQRLENATFAWKGLFGEDISVADLPNVSLCISGGGFRAMVGSLGFLMELEEQGLLGLATYLTTLSGSTWAVAPWISSGMSLVDFKDSLLERVGRGLIDPKRFAADSIELVKLLPLFAAQVFRRLAFKQPINFIDFYGFALAQMLLRELTDRNPESFTLADQQKRLERGDVPFPIYTAAIDKTFPYEWLEFNPYEVGSSFLGGSIPAWSLGRSFENGVSVDFAPPLSLSYLMAIWGSAMALNFKDVYYIAIKKMTPKTIFIPLAQQFADTAPGDIRFTAAWLNNFTYQMRGLPFAEKKTIGCVDAGVLFGIPILPLLKKERDVNIIIIGDCSAGDPGAEVKKFERYFKQSKTKFPPIDWDSIGNTSSLWYDKDDPSVPVVVYIPHAPNKSYDPSYNPKDYMGTGGYLNTVNVVYSRDNINKYSGLLQANVRDSVATIKQGLQLARENKRKLLSV